MTKKEAQPSAILSFSFFFLWFSISFAKYLFFFFTCLFVP